MADVPDSKSGGATRVGSSPTTGTKQKREPSGLSFVWYVIFIRTRTRAVVNGLPGAAQSREACPHRSAGSSLLSRTRQCPDSNRIRALFFSCRRLFPMVKYPQNNAALSFDLERKPCRSRLCGGSSFPGPERKQERETEGRTLRWDQNGEEESKDGR